jgi:NADH-quinone oxidoreductase subunit J
MTSYDIIFYIFAIATLLSAGIVVFSKNIVYAAFSLLFTFTAVAGIYVLLNADFIAITQLLIYVGGIMVLMLFGVMLTTNASNVELNTQTLKSLPATVIVAIISALLVSTMISTKWKTVESGEPIQTTVAGLGELLLTKYLLPFEIASIVLLVAIIGAAFLARRH